MRVRIEFVCQRCEARTERRERSQFSVLQWCPKCGGQVQATRVVSGRAERERLLVQQGSLERGVIAL